ncbi:hypothetical protein [uncultured Helicobacter sp.]|uniref:hypothetical protein n=1 Tax=uncultured Helicobacter sp. TaxID=175537 RepID=UPI00374F71DB
MRDSQSPRVIFTLTSFPPRITTLHHTLFSLLLQDTPADKIAVFLSLEEFPAGMESLPRILRLLHKWEFVHIHLVQPNYKSYKKLIHALLVYPDDVLVTIDDDQLYDRAMLTLLVRSYQRYPRCIHTHAGDVLHIESSGAFVWRNDNHEDIAQLALCPLGVSGVLYPPHCLDTRVFDMDTFLELAPHNDDLWFFVMGVLKGSQKILVKGALGHSKNPAIATFESPNLWETNSQSGQNRFMIEWENLVRAYPQIGEILYNHNMR